MPPLQPQPQNPAMGQNMAQPSPQLSTGTPLSNDQLSQQGANGMSHDDTAAALGYITTLSEHMFHHGNPADDLSSSGTQNSTSDTGTTDQKHNDEQDKEIEAIRKELEVLKQDDQTGKNNPTTE